MTSLRIRLGLSVTAALCSVCFVTATVGTSGLLSISADAINTTGWEDSPYLSPDGTSLYFMYTPWSTWPVFFGRPPVLLGPERPGHHMNPDRNPWEDSDIYVSTRLPGGTWSAPQNIGLNDSRADCCAMTWDGVVIAYQRTQAPNSALTDIYFAYKQPDGSWVRSPAGAGVNSPFTSESNPHLSADGRTLYFTSDRAGGLGGTDLYESRRLVDGGWGAAENLGPAFNTPAREDQIWVSRDGRTIYFNREPGPQILVSRLMGDAWSHPQPVLFGGRLVAGAEPSLTDDQSLIVFAEVRPDLEDILIVGARRLADGTWSDVSPVNALPPLGSGQLPLLSGNQRRHRR